MRRDIITTLFGTREERYSSFVGFLIWHYKQVHDLFTKADEDENYSYEKLSSVQTEVCPGGIENRIDIFLTYRSGFRLAIENKKFSPLHNEQLKRYQEILKINTDGKFKLVLLHPSMSYYSNDEIPNGVSRVTYAELIKTINGIADKRELLTSILEFFKTLEMVPISTDEITALNNYFEAKGKVTAIVKDICDKKGASLEDWAGRYVLGYKNVGEFPIYFGFRTGNDWYYAADYDKPECIVYVKDNRVEGDHVAFNESTKHIYQEIQNNNKVDEESIFYYPRIGVNECRLAIKKPLDSFVGQDLGKITEWLNDTLDLLYKEVVETSSSAS